ncbi:hypothetical protein B0H14DRAFT_3734712 [Mycena olivaceomarginata]|nr:hypothetical protein B0H14DRAFT_3734712 [Mycena olivaceomarginata]
MNLACVSPPFSIPLHSSISPSALLKSGLNETGTNSTTTEKERGLNIDVPPMLARNAFMRLGARIHSAAIAVLRWKTIAPLRTLCAPPTPLSPALPVLPRRSRSMRPLPPPRTTRPPALWAPEAQAPLLPPPVRAAYNATASRTFSDLIQYPTPSPRITYSTNRSSLLIFLGFHLVDLINFVFPPSIVADPAICIVQAILSPFNAFVDEFNSTILHTVPGESHCYVSSDSIENSEDGMDEGVFSDPEFLNSLQEPGIPPTNWF